MTDKRLFVCMATLFALTFSVYFPALSLGFVDYDDNIYVFQNPHVQAGLSKESIVYALTTFDSGNWIPATWLSYLIDATCFGIRPIAFHATNVLLHICNVTLLLIWLHRTTKSVWRSFAVAALFAVHPLHVESVAWVAERKDVLSMFFFLWMLIAYHAYSCRPNLWRYFLVAILFALGLLSKSMLVTAPFLLCLTDIWPGSTWNNDESLPTSNAPTRSLWVVICEKLPLLLMAIGIGLVTIRAQGAGATTAFTSFSRIPIGYRIGNAITAYAWYIVKSFVPTGLCTMYSHPMKNLSWPLVGVSSLLLIACLTFVISMHRRRAFLLFGSSWFLISLAPVIGLLQVGTQSYADRYSYLPQIGLWIAVVWQLELWLRTSPAKRFVAATSLTVALVVFSILSIRQIGFWESAETLWNRAIAASSDNWEAHRQLGMLCLRQQRFDEANRHFQSVIEVNPNLPDVLSSMGWIHQQRAELEEAQRFYQRSLALNPGNEFSIRNLVLVLKHQRKTADALPYLLLYTQRQPRDVNMLNQLGLIYARGGNFEQARLQFAQAKQVAPEGLPTRTNLGLALLELGKLDEARLNLQVVVDAQPKDANARVNLGLVLFRLGVKEAARQQFEAAIQINPNDQEARAQLELINQPTSTPSP